MKIIDTHTHLYLPEFETDRDEVIIRAVERGVSCLLMPNIDIGSVEPMLSAEKRYKGICYSMIGLHPTSVRDDYRSQLDQIEDLAGKHKYVAVGEIGIDLYWDKSHISEQMDAFRFQVRLALEKDLPVVIHSREAFNEIFSLLEEFRGEELKGVFHAFSGDLETAEKAIGLGFKLGIGGIVTFKNSGLDRIINTIDPENILIETDSPYLAPSPYRGTRNESSYAAIIAQKIAEIYDTDIDNIAGITTSNAMKLFNLE